jgi:hypothetical protein
MKFHRACLQVRPFVLRHLFMLWKSMAAVLKFFLPFLVHQKLGFICEFASTRLQEESNMVAFCQLKHLGLCGGLLLAMAHSAQAAGNAYSTEHVKLAFLVAVLCGLIVFLYALNFVVRLVVGYVQHRRACRIAVVLETEIMEFAGFLSIIGLNGCRFQPINKTVEAKLLKQLSSKEFYDYDVKIGGKTYPVFVDGYHGFFSALYFYDAIDRDELAQILVLSKIKPYLVPRIGHETSRKVWRANIESRQEKIAALKAAQKLKDREAALQRQMNAPKSNQSMV